MGTTSLASLPPAHQPLSRAETLNIVKELKEKNEDFEYYPTTADQLLAITNDVKAILETHEFKGTTIKLLDVGAGCGSALLSLANGLSGLGYDCDMFAIEKATTHIKTYAAKNITLLGTEFKETNFITKSADIAFTNCPYSELEPWMATLISQMNFRLMYAIMPERWQESPLIKQAIKQRCIVDVKVIATSDFLDAHRQARAKVHVVRLAFENFEEDTKKWKAFGIHDYTPKVGDGMTNSFQLFLGELGLKKSVSATNAFYESRVKESIAAKLTEEGSESLALVESKGVVHALIDNYERDLKHIVGQYRKIGELDAEILSELGVDLTSVHKGLQEKLYGYRAVYWDYLFDYLDTLKERLTNKHRTELLNALNQNGLDFTYLNAVYIIDYAVTASNERMEQSLVDVFKDLTSEQSIARHYKSNEHVYSDSWRHNSDRLNMGARFALDYRFIYSGYKNFSASKDGLDSSAVSFIGDLMVIMRLLGYSNLNTDKELAEVEAGESVCVRGNSPQGKEQTLIQMRFHKNGSRHLKWDQELMLRFNVTVSRLLGWVRSKEDYERETGAEQPISHEIWSARDNLQLHSSAVLRLVNHSPF